MESQTEIATLTGHSSYVNSVAFNSSGNILASGSSDRTIKLWNVESQTEIATLTGHSSYVNSVAFNSSGNILASGSMDRDNKTMECGISN